MEGEGGYLADGEGPSCAAVFHFSTIVYVCDSENALIRDIIHWFGHSAEAVTGTSEYDMCLLRVFAAMLDRGKFR